MAADIEVIGAYTIGLKCYHNLESGHLIGNFYAYGYDKKLLHISSNKKGKWTGKLYKFCANNSLFIYCGNFINGKEYGYTLRPQPHQGQKILEKVSRRKN